MLKLIATPFFVLTVFCARAQINIGQPVTRYFKTVDSTRYLLVEPASIQKAYSVTFNGIHYDLILDKKSRIKMIFVTDKHFATPDDVKVDMSYKSIKTQLIE